LGDGFLDGLGGVAAQARAEELPGQADPQAGQGFGQVAGVILLLPLQAGGIPRVEARHDVEQQGAVLGGLRHGAALVQGGGEGDHAVAGHHAVGGFQAGDAAQGRRLADGAAGVGAGGRRGQARGNAGRAAAGGTARHPGGIPGVLHRTVEAGLVGRAHGELVHVGLAQAGHAGRLEPLDDMGVVGRDKVGQHLRAAGGEPALGAEDVLVGDGHAGEGVSLAGGAARVGGGGLGQGLVRVHGNEGVERVIQGLDPAQVVPAQLDAGSLAIGEELGEVFEGVINHGKPCGGNGKRETGNAPCRYFSRFPFLFSRFIQ
jgi:hypothetical protein